MQKEVDREVADEEGCGDLRGHAERVGESAAAHTTRTGDQPRQTRDERRLWERGPAPLLTASCIAAQTETHGRLAVHVTVTSPQRRLRVHLRGHRLASAELPERLCKEAAPDTREGSVECGRGVRRCCVRDGGAPVMEALSTPPPSMSSSALQPVVIFSTCSRFSNI
jgi:hypothetical protein